jgi:hypothetical protein
VFVGWLSLAAQHPAQQQVHAAGQIEPVPAYTPYGPLSADACYHAKSRDTADLCAQWRGALAAERAAKAARDAVTWTIVSTVLSAIALLGLLFTLRQTERALGEAQRGNLISEDTAKRQLRAYVLGDEFALSSFGPGQYMKASFNLRNFGQTPASDVKCVTSMRSFAGDPVGWKFLFRVIPRAGVFSSSILGPGQAHPHINQANAELTIDQWNFFTNGTLTLMFAGVISYRDIFGKRHLTTFRYFLDRGANLAGTIALSACEKGNRAS